MKELKKDTWYKFDPYNDDWRSTWWIKADRDQTDKEMNKSNGHVAIESTGKNPRYIMSSGSFGVGTYFHNECPYTEATPQETLWLETIATRGKYFPIEEMKFDQVINNYEIY